MQGLFSHAASWLRAAPADNSNTFDRWLAQQPGVLSVRALPKAHAPIVQAVLDGDPQPISQGERDER